MADASPLPARRPMGAFRGGLFGFLLGCTLSGGSVYGYLLKEYKTANDLLSEDIYVRGLMETPTPPTNASPIVTRRRIESQANIALPGSANSGVSPEHLRSDA
jgi:hypothetical protein